MKLIGDFKNLVQMKPTIVMTYELHAQIMRFVNGVDAMECQWFLTIEKTIATRGDRVFYSLQDMLIPTQEVSGATVESNPQTGMFALFSELKQTYRTEVDGVDAPDMERVNEIVGKMHCWCHSHVNMAPNPSGTDEATFREWCKSNADQGLNHPVIMMIVNKKEDVYLRLWDPELNLYCENPGIQLLYPEVDFTYVDDAIANKVKRKAYANSPSSSYSGQYFGGVRVVGPSDSVGKSTAPSGTVTSSAQVPSLVVTGRSLLGATTKDCKIEMDLIRVATSAGADEEAGNVTLTLDRSLKDDSELYIFSLLLAGKRTEIEELVPKTRFAFPPRAEILAVINLMVKDNWTEHPHVFYSLVGAAKYIASIPGKPNKRLREANTVMDRLVDIQENYSKIYPFQDIGDEVTSTSIVTRTL